MISRGGGGGGGEEKRGEERSSSVGISALFYAKKIQFESKEIRAKTRNWKEHFWMIHSPVSEQTCCTLPLIQIIFHWSLQERDFLTFSSSPKWSQCGFLLSLLRDKTLRKKSNQTFFFFFSIRVFAVFSAAKRKRAPAETCATTPQTDWLTASSGHTRCCRRCSWRVKAPPLSLHTLRDASRCCCGSRVCGAQVRRQTHTARQEEMERLSKQ